MDLAERWAQTWNTIGSPAPNGLLADLRARYGEPQRAYHTSEHLEECFGHLDACGVEPEDRAALELALWFHDAVYDPRAKDNEAQSARLARERLGDLDPTRLDRIEDLILATAHHAPNGDRDALLLVDVDLAILGADEERFTAYEHQIRQEYDWVPRFVYRRERRKVLRRFLEREPIFGTAWFRARFEARARANIERVF